MPGESAFFDTWLLDGGPEDAELLAAQAFGGCWVRALRASPWGPLWAAKVLRHARTVLGQPVIGQVDEGTLLRNPRTGVITWVRPCGAQAELPVPALAKAVRRDGARWLEQRSEHNLHDLPPAFAAELQAGLRDRGEVSLGVLVDHLGVRDQLLHPDAVDTSTLVFDRRLRRYWDRTSTSSSSRTFLVVPEAVAAAASA